MNLSKNGFRFAMARVIPTLLDEFEAKQLRIQHPLPVQQQ